MARLENYILCPHGLDEAAYPGNIGFEEMVLFYKDASKAEEKQMAEIIKKGDWDAFRKLIYKVTGKKLK